MHVKRKKEERMEGKRERKRKGRKGKGRKVLHLGVSKSGFELFLV